MSGARRSARALAVALLVMVLSVLPPGLHFVLGPLAPLIGGLAGGMVGRLSGEEAFLLGAVDALAAAVTAGILLPYLGHLHLGTATLVFFAVTAALYAGVLSGVAAYFGGRHARSHS